LVKSTRKFYASSLHKDTSCHYYNRRRCSK
jgi:hypothetical protein